MIDINDRYKSVEVSTVTMQDGDLLPALSSFPDYSYKMQQKTVGLRMPAIVKTSIKLAVLIHLDRQLVFADLDDSWMSSARPFPQQP